MRGTKIEKEAEICATNLANKTKFQAYACSITIFIAYFLVISRRISLVFSD
jgi:hypothetical protein